MGKPEKDSRAYLVQAREVHALVKWRRVWRRTMVGQAGFDSLGGGGRGDSSGAVLEKRRLNGGEWKPAVLCVTVHANRKHAR